MNESCITVLKVASAACTLLEEHIRGTQRNVEAALRAVGAELA